MINAVYIGVHQRCIYQNDLIYTPSIYTTFMSFKDMAHDPFKFSSEIFCFRSKTRGLHILLFIINLFMTEFRVYRNQYINLLCKFMDWFLYESVLRHGKNKSALLCLRKLLATENPLKITWNIFYSTLKALSVFKVFKLLSLFFWSRRKNGLWRKLRLFSKLHKLGNGETNC